MSYVIYPLHFDTDVHFAPSGRGGRLDEACMEYTADALFGALCTELAAAGEQTMLTRLMDSIETGGLRLSDLLPWQRRASDRAVALFLPRPVLRIERSVQAEREDYRTTCANATLRKKQKNLKYLRASRMQDYIRAMESGTPFEDNDFDGDFGTLSLRQRVNTRGTEPLPYYVGQFTFADGAGLYLLAQIQDEALIPWLHRLLTWLGTAANARAAAANSTSATSSVWMRAAASTRQHSAPCSRQSTPRGSSHSRPYCPQRTTSPP